MMSDEEKVGDTYVRHPPAYRSERLNRFIQKLDSCLDSTPSRHARHTRVLGSPVEKRIPARAKSWMLKENEGTAIAGRSDDQNAEAEGPDHDLFGQTQRKLKTPTNKLMN